MEPKMKTTMEALHHLYNRRKEWTIALAEAKREIRRLDKQIKLVQKTNKLLIDLVPTTPRGWSVAG